MVRRGGRACSLSSSKELFEERPSLSFGGERLPIVVRAMIDIAFRRPLLFFLLYVVVLISSSFSLPRCARRISRFIHVRAQEPAGTQADLPHRLQRSTNYLATAG